MYGLTIKLLWVPLIFLFMYLMYIFSILRLSVIDLDSPAVIPVDLKQTIQVDEDLQIRAYYAGHVRPR